MLRWGEGEGKGEGAPSWPESPPEQQTSGQPAPPRRPAALLTPKPPGPHLLQLVGLRLVLIAVGVLTVRQAQPPDGQDAVDVIADPGIAVIGAGGQQPGHGVLRTARSGGRRGGRRLGAPTPAAQRPAPRVSPGAGGWFAAPGGRSRPAARPSCCGRAWRRRGKRRSAGRERGGMRAEGRLTEPPRPGAGRSTASSKGFAPPRSSTPSRNRCLRDVSSGLLARSAPQLLGGGGGGAARNAHYAAVRTWRPRGRWEGRRAAPSGGRRPRRAGGDRGPYGDMGRDGRQLPSADAGGTDGYTERAATRCHPRAARVTGEAHLH